MIKAGLLKLGLITDARGEQYRLWYTHGASHYIGIDVHDVGSRARALQPGMAFTIEPGIYIRQSALDALPRTPENLAFIEQVQPAVRQYADIGVRIEDSFLVEETGLRQSVGGRPEDDRGRRGLPACEGTRAEAAMTIAGALDGQPPTVPRGVREPRRRVGAGCGAPSVPSSARRSSPATRSAAAARDFLWKVSGATGSVYLVGSVHLLTKDFYPLSPALEQAFKESDLLVEEADLAELLAPAAQMQMLARGMLPASTTLDAVVSPATFALVATRAKELGLPLEPLKRFKPWSLALMLDVAPVAEGRL